MLSGWSYHLLVSISYYTTKFYILHIQQFLTLLRSNFLLSQKLSGEIIDMTRSRSASGWSSCRHSLQSRVEQWRRWRQTSLETSRPCLGWRHTRNILILGVSWDNLLRLQLNKENFSLFRSRKCYQRRVSAWNLDYFSLNCATSCSQCTASLAWHARWRYTDCCPSLCKNNS